MFIDNESMTRQITYAQAISEAQVQAMEANPNIFLFGLGVNDCKGIFGTTLEATKRFGESRVFDVPACENALTGIGIGAAINGKHPVLVHARHDFMFLALDQMVNNAAKWKYTYAGKTAVPLAIRAIIGKGWGQGPTHSQNLQAVLMHFPGLVVTAPSNAYDVKGIIMEALNFQGPVVIIEHRGLYDLKMAVPEGAFRLAFGKARISREGRDVTVVATSSMVPEALRAAYILSEFGIELEVIDPVTLQPLDEDAILNSVQKTGRLICADGDWLNCSFTAEVAARMADKAFHALKAPIKRIGWPDCPAGVSKTMEEVFHPTHKNIIRTVLEILDKPPMSIPDVEIKDTFVGPY
jgi:pyruvate/2-oxoglutarate/acetoin dehydrogenase E1 component